MGCPLGLGTEILSSLERYNTHLHSTDIVMNEFGGDRRLAQLEMRGREGRQLGAGQLNAKALSGKLPMPVTKLEMNWRGVLSFFCLARRDSPFRRLQRILFTFSPAHEFFVSILSRSSGLYGASRRNYSTYITSNGNSKWICLAIKSSLKNK